MNTQTMLTAAGFCVKTPEAEKQRELYAALGWYDAFGSNHYGVSPVSYSFAR